SGVGGGGVDMVGDFIMKGDVRGDEGLVEKSYVGRHAVLYHGKLDEKGGIVGRWRVEGDGGGHFLWVPPGGGDPWPPAAGGVRGGKRSGFRVGPVAEKVPTPPQGKGCLGVVLLAAVIVALAVGGL